MLLVVSYWLWWWMVRHRLLRVEEVYHLSILCHQVQVLFLSNESVWQRVRLRGSSRCVAGCWGWSQKVQDEVVEMLMGVLGEIFFC